MYGGIDQSTSDGGSNRLAPQKPEIPNVRVDSIKYACSSEKDDSKPWGIVIVIKAEDGRQHREVLFDINVERLKQVAEAGKYIHRSGEKKGQVMTADEVIKTELTKINRTVTHILRAIMPREKAIIPKAQSFKEFAMAVEKTAAPYTGESSEPLKLKLVYDKRGNVTFPPYNSFLLPMSSSEQFIWTEHDHVKPPTPAREGTDGPELSNGADTDDQPNQEWFKEAEGQEKSS